MVDFPNTPQEGDIHSENGQSWQYVGGAWVINAQSGGNASVEIGDTLPSDPEHGDQFYLTREPVGMYIFLDENVLGTGTSAQWVQQNGGGVQPSNNYRAVQIYPEATQTITGASNVFYDVNLGAVETYGQAFGAKNGAVNYRIDESGLYRIRWSMLLLDNIVDGVRYRISARLNLNGSMGANIGDAHAEGYIRGLAGTGTSTIRESISNEIIYPLEAGDFIGYKLNPIREDGTNLNLGIQVAGTLLIIEKVA